MANLPLLPSVRVAGSDTIKVSGRSVSDTRSGTGVGPHIRIGLESRSNQFFGNLGYPIGLLLTLTYVNSQNIGSRAFAIPRVRIQ